ncbi:MAG: DNA-directed RNA polymerase subunit omega [Wolbachia endosymbiont of Menacanthus eurysternus]|nr:MAG: DNA-directed RNA polymerase subunit omega [Wolbachia endosymbiont of Menacanthus eurysternus]
MAESIIEKCTEYINNRFKLVLLASQRTRDLNTGVGNPVEAIRFKYHKNTVISLCEIAEGQVDIYELFSFLVNRCREYMRGNIGSGVYSGSSKKLERLLDFSGSDNKFDSDSSFSHGFIDIRKHDIETEINDQNKNSKNIEERK